MPLTLLDIILMLFAILSGVLAMMRGFSREVLSVLGWVCAAAAGVYTFFSPEIKAFAHEYITPEWLADIVTVSGVFLTTLFVISFSTVRISDMILDSRIGFLDRSLGFAFGLLRGTAIVLMAYMLFSKLIPVDAHPDWIKNARSQALLQTWSDVVYDNLPDDAAAKIKTLKDNNLSSFSKQSDEKMIAPPISNYKLDEKKALDKHIQGIGTGQ